MQLYMKERFLHTGFAPDGKDKEAETASLPDYMALAP